MPTKREQLVALLGEHALKFLTRTVDDGQLFIVKFTTPREYYVYAQLSAFYNRGEHTLKLRRRQMLNLEYRGIIEQTMAARGHRIYTLTKSGLQYFRREP